MRSLLLLALLALTPACDRSPEDPVFAYGRVLQLNGSPNAGAPLTLERFDTDAFAPLATATTGSTGDYTLEMLSGDVADRYGASVDFYRFRLRLALPLDEDGRGVFASFFMQDDVELPTLQPWDAHPRVDASGAVAFPPAPPAPPPPVSAKTFSLVFEDAPDAPIPLLPTTPEPLLWLTSGGALLWRETGTTSPWAPSPFVLEDFAFPRVQLRAVSVGFWSFSPLGGEPSSVDFRLEWRTASESLPQGTLRPVSRGATCFPSFPDACPWTDGRLEAVDFTAHPSDPSVETLTLQLPQAAAPRRAVVRGLRYTEGDEDRDWLRLEGSPDGEHWQTLARPVLRDLDSRARRLRSATFRGPGVQKTAEDSPYGEGPLHLGFEEPRFLDLPLTDVGPVRFVRLSVETQTYSDGVQPTALLSLAELSVFP